MIAQGAYATAPANEALPDMDVYPLLGPMGGGTEIVLEVSCRVFFTSILHASCCVICQLAEHTGFVQCVQFAVVVGDAKYSMNQAWLKAYALAQQADRQAACGTTDAVNGGQRVQA